MRAGPQRLSTRTIPVMELSVSDASGWRPQQPSVVSQYVATFPEDYGRTITAGVTVVSKDSAGDPAVDQDGTFIIDDGKSTVAALQNLFLKWNAVDREHMASSGMCPALMDVLLNGLPVTMVLYEDSAPVHRMAWHVGTHDEDANRYLQSSIPQKVALCKRVLGQLGSKADWPDVTKWLSQLYGSRKERDIRRWVLAAKVLTDDVLQCLTDRITAAGLDHGIVSSQIFDNPFICVPPGQSKSMLPSHLKVAALSQLFDTIDNGTRVTTQSFQSEFCKPLPMAQWFHRFPERSTNSVHPSPETPGPPNPMGICVAVQLQCPVACLRPAQVGWASVGEEQGEEVWRAGNWQCHLDESGGTVGNLPTAAAGCTGSSWAWGPAGCSTGQGWRGGVPCDLCAF